MPTAPAPIKTKTLVKVLAWLSSPLLLIGAVLFVSESVRDPQWISLCVSVPSICIVLAAYFYVLLDKQTPNWLKGWWEKSPAELSFTSPVVAESVQKKFDEIQQRHSGENPFRALDDLSRLYHSLSGGEGESFWLALAERRNNSSWSWLADEFVRHASPPEWYRRKP
jgi:hypothetical protein